MTVSAWLQVWDTPSIAMKLPFATPSPSRRPSEAGSGAGGPESDSPEHPWGMVLSQFATVARHDPRTEVPTMCCLSHAHVFHLHALQLTACACFQLFMLQLPS